MEKEDFISDILNSANGISKAVPNDAIFQRINQKINANFISRKTIYLAAASVVVLISINIMLLLASTHTKTSEIASIVNSINKSNQLYN
jgi:cell division protein ZapA (FtsZ GTPase activity inhibitor)